MPPTTTNNNNSSEIIHSKYSTIISFANTRSNKWQPFRSSNR
jgi:hypothetical protein